MNRIICLIILLFISHGIMAQQNRIKLGLIVVPFQSGFGIVNAGYERLNAGKDKSFQFLASAIAGTIANDGPSDERFWLTAERIKYIGNKEKNTRPYYTLFVEAGTRKSSPGMFKDIPGRRLVNKRSFEISPGIGLGAAFSIGKRFGLDLSTGPKVIFRNGKYHYYDPVIREGSTEPLSQVKIGSRFSFSFFYQF